MSGIQVEGDDEVFGNGQSYNASTLSNQSVTGQIHAPHCCCHLNEKGKRIKLDVCAKGIFVDWHLVPDDDLTSDC